MAYPCAGPQVSVLRMRRSRVPWRRSVGRGIYPLTVDVWEEFAPAYIGCQWVTQPGTVISSPTWRYLASRSPHHAGNTRERLTELTGNLMRIGVGGRGDANAIRY